MLDREEDAALAEIEAALRREDPDFVALLERIDAPAGTVIAEARAEPDPVVVPELAPVDQMTAASVVPGGSIVPGAPFVPAVRRALISIGILVTAVAVTLGTAMVFGPNAGGLVGVVSLSCAGMFVYQWLRGCPGTRRA